MQACVLHAIGDLRVEEVPLPEPAPGEVRVRISACGICGSDIPRVFTKGTYNFPTIPGHEFSGVVDSLGEGVHAEWAHAPVAIFPLLPCFKCEACAQQAYAQCEDYNYLGSRCDGAFAEYVCAPTWNLLRVPHGVSLEEAAMVEPLAVAAHALRRTQPDPGDTILIFGAGPIGLMVAQWAKTWGLGKIMLVDVDVEKLRFAKKLGYEHLLDARESDPVEWVRTKTKGGPHIVIEAAGSPIALGQAFQAVRDFGKVVLLGNPAGDMPLSQADYWAVMRKEVTVLGTWNSVYKGYPKNEWQLVLDALATGTVDVTPLISHRCNLDELMTHMELMRDRSAFSNKILYVNPDATK